MTNPASSYAYLLDRAQELWPKRVDLTPRTLREDALLTIVCALIDEASFHDTTEVQRLQNQVSRLQDHNTTLVLANRELRRKLQELEDKYHPALDGVPDPE